MRCPQSREVSSRHSASQLSWFRGDQCLVRASPISECLPGWGAGLVQVIYMSVVPTHRGGGGACRSTPRRARTSDMNCGDRPTDSARSRMPCLAGGDVAFCLLLRMTEGPDSWRLSWLEPRGRAGRVACERGLHVRVSSRVADVVGAVQGDRHSCNRDQQGGRG